MSLLFVQRSRIDDLDSVYDDDHDAFVDELASYDVEALMWKKKYTGRQDETARMS